MERDNAVHAGGETVTSPLVEGRFGVDFVDPDEHRAVNRRPLQLLDLSVTETERHALVHSPHQARIRLRLPETEAISHPSLLMYIANHLQGRCPYPSVEDDNVLDILYYVSDDSEELATEVRRFAHDVLRVLGLPETGLAGCWIQTIDDRTRRGVLTAAGVERPELRLV